MTTHSDAGANELSGWLTRHLEAGLTRTTVSPGDATTARLLTASTSPPLDHDTAVLLADQHVVSLPFETGPSTVYDIQLVGLGERVAVFHWAGGNPAVWLLDPISRAWSPGPDLGLGTIPNNSSPWVGNVDGSLLISVDVWADRGDGMWAPVDQRGVLVSPDLEVTPIAPPPVPIPMAWTTVMGTHALLMGIDSAAGANEPLRQPWAYDTATDTWTAVPQPDWVECGSDGLACPWTAPHEYPDPFLETVTPHGVVKLTPDGTVGLFDPDTWMWRRLDDTPFTPSGTQAVALNDNVVAVFPQRLYGTPDSLCTVGLLDIPSGTWTTTQPDLADATNSAFMWDLRLGDDAVLVGTLDFDFNGDPRPRIALDRATGQWRTPSDADAELWRRLYTGATTTQDLLTSQATTA